MIINIAYEIVSFALATEPNPQFLINLHLDAVKGCDTSM